MAETADIAIVGGGLVGLATAYQLSQRDPKMRVVVLEKESAVGVHQSGHNSGVIHSGLYYQPGSLKAKNCVHGRRLLIDYAQAHGIPHEICGKVVVATEPDEIPHLKRIMGNGEANGLAGLERIDRAGIREHEPHCQGIDGLWVPETGIMDFPAMSRSLAQRFQDCGVRNQLLLGQAVQGIRTDADSCELRSTQGSISCGRVIACGGLQSDRLARLAGADPGLRIVPFRGDYYELAAHARSRVRGLIYPVPNPAFPFLGVHFTRMTTGAVECGPNAVFNFKREGYGKTDFALRDTASSLSYAGTWRLFAKHWRQGLEEYRRAFSKARFLQSLQRLIPELDMNDIQPARAGVRAQALGPDGKMIDDFRIVQHGPAIHVLNAPSPAATACLAIGEHISSLV
jgi:(S)-2-hydroxyglutarate dehydrogenase